MHAEITKELEALSLFFAFKKTNTRLLYSLPFCDRKTDIYIHTTHISSVFMCAIMHVQFPVFSISQLTIYLEACI